MRKPNNLAKKKGNNLTSAQTSFGNRSVSDKKRVTNNEKYGCMRIHEIKGYKPDVLSQIIVDCLKIRNIMMRLLPIIY